MVFCHTPYISVFTLKLNIVTEKMVSKYMLGFALEFLSIFYLFILIIHRLTAR